MNNKLDYFKRRNTGKNILNEYEFFFSKYFPALEWYKLEESDLILEPLKGKLPFLESEIIKNMIGINVYNSKLLFKTYEQLEDRQKTYIFSDDYIFCGLFLVNAKEAFENVFEVAKADKGNTIFLLDENYSYYYVINYYDITHADFSDSFEIKRSS